MGFYVAEAEMDGRAHVLSVTLPAKPKFELRYRSRYTASAIATSPTVTPELTGPAAKPQPVGPLPSDEVGIDAKIETAAKNELRVSLALAPETVSRVADGTIVLDATFSQTDGRGKQLAKVQDSVGVPAPETPSDMVPYGRTLKRINGAVLLHITIRDQATNRAGSIVIPIGQH
jgi:hypothetical protein